MQNTHTNSLRMTAAALLVTAVIGCGRDREHNSVSAGPPAALEAPKAGQGAGGSAVSAGDAPHVAVPSEEPVVRLRKELETAAAADPAAAERMRAIGPVLKCVERSSDGKRVAHFGFANKSEKVSLIPVGFYNRIWPPPIQQGQPTSFTAGARADVLQIPFDGASSVAWVLGAAFQIADSSSPACPSAAGMNPPVTAKGDHGRPRDRSPRR